MGLAVAAFAGRYEGEPKIDDLLHLHCVIVASQRAGHAALMIRVMEDLPDGLTFDPENCGWENIRAWYRGKFAGDVHACRDRKRGWRASIYCGPRDLVLGVFDSRDEGKRAVIAWFRGLEIEEWPAP